MKFRVEKFVGWSPSGLPLRKLWTVTNDRNDAERHAALIGGRAFDTETGEVWTENMGFWMLPFVKVEVTK